MLYSSGKYKLYTKVVLAAAVMLLLMILAANGSAAPPQGDEEFSVIADANNAFLNASPTISMSSPELMALLDDDGDGTIGSAGDDPANDPLVIDVRNATHYSGLGHIPGAINIAPYKDIVKPANLLLIRSELAKHANKTIVLACYTGHTDKLALDALASVGAAGYFGAVAPNVTALKWGNLEWNTASEEPDGHVPSYTNTYGIETTPHVLPAPGSYPMIDNTASTEPAEIVRTGEDLGLGVTAAGPFIFPGAGVGQINDGNIGSYTVIDVRSSADYAAGHITGAVNIPYQDLFDQDAGGDYTNLLSVDTSKPVIVYSNGQQEANAAAVGMNTLGIRNATTSTKSLRFGLAYWNKDYGTQFVNVDGADRHAYPIMTGSAPGGLTYSASCAGSKPGLMLGAPAPYWASSGDYSAGLLSVDWTVSNAGGTIAYDVKLTGSTNNNGVTLATALPVTVANITSPGGSAGVTLQYNVPAGVGSWHTSITGSSTDICGNSYTHP